ncbi:hypothetical protein FSARC_12865 [Fusarium sarcochroum]|uniref:CCHC-type domain-containing protein n=1 Tax=Fusarium sarcochroum TaxID=1208366 RepID=A0A8H4T5E6_9HYPO|nr:hypothetical protein FSARC_12865 [Fusarium sarcochroum]
MPTLREQAEAAATETKRSAPTSRKFCHRCGEQDHPEGQCPKKAEEKHRLRAEGVALAQVVMNAEVVQAKQEVAELKKENRELKRKVYNLEENMEAVLTWL